jgi:hypothetical protein
MTLVWTMEEATTWSIGVLMHVAGLLGMEAGGGTVKHDCVAIGSGMNVISNGSSPFEQFKC